MNCQRSYAWTDKSHLNYSDSDGGKAAIEGKSRSRSQNIASSASGRLKRVPVTASTLCTPGITTSTLPPFPCAHHSGVLGSLGDLV